MSLFSKSKSCNTTYLAMQKSGPLDIWTYCFTFNPQNSKLKIYSHSTPHKSMWMSDHGFVHLSHVHKVIKQGTNKSTCMLGVYQLYPTFLPLPSFSDNHSFEALYGHHWFSVWFIIMIAVSKLQPIMNGQHNFEALCGGQ